MKRTVSLLLLASCVSVVALSGCSKPKQAEPEKIEQTQPAPEEQKPVEAVEQQQQPAEQTAPVAEPAPEAQAAK